MLLVKSERSLMENRFLNDTSYCVLTGMLLVCLSQQLS